MVAVEILMEADAVKIPGRMETLDEFRRWARSDSFPQRGRAATARGLAELEGPPELIVECVSDSSVVKDSERLLEAYHRAGVREYWLIDARRAEPSLTIRQHTTSGWSEAAADASAFRTSPLLGTALRLDRLPPRAGLVRSKLARG